MPTSYANSLLASVLRRTVARHIALALPVLLIALGGCGGSGGSDSSPALPTSGPPQIVRQLPPDFAVVIGMSEGVSLELVAGGEAPLRYQWRRDGIEIAGATASRYTIPPPRSAPQSEIYTVEVTNAKGSVVATPMKLRVLTAATGPAADRVRSVISPLRTLIAAANAGLWAAITDGVLSVNSWLPECQSGSVTLTVDGVLARVKTALPFPAGRLSSVYQNCELQRGFGMLDDGSVDITYDYVPTPQWVVHATVRGFRQRRTWLGDIRVDGQLRREHAVETMADKGSLWRTDSILVEPTPGATSVNLQTGRQTTLAGGRYRFMAVNEVGNRGQMMGSWDPGSWTADGLTIVVGADTYVLSGTSRASLGECWCELTEDARRIRLTHNGEHIAELASATETADFEYTVYRLLTPREPLGGGKRRRHSMPEDLRQEVLRALALRIAEELVPACPAPRSGRRP